VAFPRRLGLSHQYFQHLSPTTPRFIAPRSSRDTAALPFCLSPTFNRPNLRNGYLTPNVRHPAPARGLKTCANEGSSNLVIILGFMQISKKIPFDDPSVLNGVRALYIVSNIIIAAIYFYVQMQINKKNGALASFPY
jgi:hypothetical protein